MDSAPAVVFGPLCLLTINGSILYDYLKLLRLLNSWLSQHVAMSSTTTFFLVFFLNIAVICFKSAFSKCPCLHPTLEKKKSNHSLFQAIHSYTNIYCNLLQLSFFPSPRIFTWMFKPSMPLIILTALLQYFYTLHFMGQPESHTRYKMKEPNGLRGWNNISSSILCSFPIIWLLNTVKRRASIFKPTTVLSGNSKPITTVCMTPA